MRTAPNVSLTIQLLCGAAVVVLRTLAPNLHPLNSPPPPLAHPPPIPTPPTNRGLRAEAGLQPNRPPAAGAVVQEQRAGPATERI